MTEITAVVRVDTRELVEVFLSRGGVALGQAVVPALQDLARAEGVLSVRPSAYSAQDDPAAFGFVITCSPSVIKAMGGEAALRERFVDMLLAHAKGFLQPRAASRETN